MQTQTEKEKRENENWKGTKTEDDDCDVFITKYLQCMHLQELKKRPKPI